MDGGPGTPATVVVLWTGYRPGPWACRSLRAGGFRVIPLHPAGRRGGRSPAAPRPGRYPWPASPEALAGAVADISAREGARAVVPMDEDLVRALATARPGGTVVVGPDAEQYAAVCDKAGLAATAVAAGVDHPATVVVDAAGADGEVPAPPAIIKPSVSHSDMQAFPIVAAGTATERDAAIERLLRAGVAALVQERVRGRRWVGHCVRGPGGLELVARIERDSPRDTGVASVQATAPAPAPLVEGIRRLLGHVDHRAPATVSFIERGGRFFVHDVNLRLGASVGLLVRAGFDMPRRAVEVGLGLDPGGREVAWRPVSYVNTEGELRALAAALRGGLDGERPVEVAVRIVRAGLRRMACSIRRPSTRSGSPSAAGGRRRSSRGASARAAAPDAARPGRRPPARGRLRLRRSHRDPGAGLRRPLGGPRAGRTSY